jgi:hypothetical protein
MLLSLYYRPSMQIDWAVLQAPTEVTAKVPIVAPSVTMPISNRDTFYPLVEREVILSSRRLCTEVTCVALFLAQATSRASPLRVGSRADGVIE